jgi:hypothetical protein
LGIDDTNFIDKWIIYPNPVVDILNFKSVDILHSIQSLKITNVLGKIVYFENNAANINSIDVSKFSSGLYIVSVNSIKETQQFKFYKK